MESPTANSSGARTRNDRASVIDAALVLLERDGLPELSMRRLGEALGVRPSALYWHFESKQALLARVSERILEPLSVTDLSGAGFADAALVLARRLRDCLLAYRDGAELVSSSFALGLVSPPLHEVLSAMARADGVPPALAETAAEALTHFVIGYVFHEQQRVSAETLGAVGVAGSLTPEAASREVKDSSEDFTKVLALFADGLVSVAERTQ